jgi:hypothetical protein
VPSRSPQRREGFRLGAGHDAVGKAVDAIEQGATRTHSSSRPSRCARTLDHDMPTSTEGGAATRCEQIAIDRLIAGFEEDRLTAVARLRRVVRVAEDDDAADAPNAYTLAALSLGLIVQWSGLD